MSELPTPDWEWTPSGAIPWEGHGTYSIDGFDEGVEYHSGPVPFDQLPNPGVFHIGGTWLPMDSKLARRGVKGVLQQVTPAGEVKAIVHIRRGPFGWFTRRWLRDHPLQYTGEMYRPEWGEWRDMTGKVEIV